LGYAAILVIAVLVLNFSLIHLAPGDVADTIAQSMGYANEALLQQIREDYNLNAPFLVQLGTYLRDMLLFDLGYSHYFNQPVIELILQKLPATLLLVLSAQLFALLVGVLLGLASMRHPNGAFSLLISFGSLFAYAAPVFWTGLLLLVTFSLKLQWFPTAGVRDVTLEGGNLAQVIDVAKHLVLPALTLGLSSLALYVRLSMAMLMEEMEADYIRAARARGLSEARVVGKHALRNAIAPVVTLAGFQLSALMSGAVLVETVFAWPGLGTLAFQSILARDVPTLLGLLFFSALIVIVGNLLTDLVQRALDPRLRARS
jgi:peptide/nickel transport system permease protein